MLFSGGFTFSNFLADRLIDIYLRAVVARRSAGQFAKTRFTLTVGPSGGRELAWCCGTEQHQRKPGDMAVRRQSIA